MDYEPTIGLEVHAELLTKSKMFCGCRADVFGAEPNTHTCPVCTGMPGSLPVINRKAVEYTIMTALALNCQIAEASIFSRKSYFYPDLPKSYQISMYDLPLSHDGWLDIETNGQTRRIGIERVHLEEDTGKLFHVGEHTLVDFNRSGVPLMEIVSKPEMHSLEEVRQYCLKVRTILRYLGVSSGDMEKGAMRFEVNVSLHPADSSERGTKVEIKNLNSFRAVLRSLEYEIERQAQILKQGGRIEQVTRGWDETQGITVLQRSKEFADDYRYFPEPDLPRLIVGRQWVEEIRSKLPELPDAKRERFVAQYGLSRYDAGVLVAERAVADYFERCVAEGRGKVEPKAISNWISGELFRLMKEEAQDIAEVAITPKGLVEMVTLVNDGTISTKIAKDVFEEMFRTGRSAREIVVARDLRQISDATELEGIVADVLVNNPDPVDEYLGGKETVLRFLVGQVMKATRGKANPTLANELLKQKLEEVKKERM